MAALGWLALGLLPRIRGASTLAILGLTGLGLAFTDVLCDAVMVEEGKARGLTARFQSIQWTAIYGASLLAGVGRRLPLGARVLQPDLPPGRALPRALVRRLRLGRARAPDALRPRHGAGDARPPCARAPARGRSGGPRRSSSSGTSRPSFGVPLEYHMVDVLGITKIQLGVLSSLGSGAAMLGALVFGRYATRLAPKPLLNLGDRHRRRRDARLLRTGGLVVGGRAHRRRSASSPPSRCWRRSTWRPGRSRGAPRGRSSPRSCR